MSLDLWLACPTCEERSGSSFNFTYNVGLMWRAVCPEDSSMVDIDGMTGAASIPKLETAIRGLVAEPERFRAMNPKNGWGSYDGFVDWLKSLLESARENPNKIWRACR